MLRSMAGQDCGFDAECSFPKRGELPPVGIVFPEIRLKQNVRDHVNEVEKVLCDVIDLYLSFLSAEESDLQICANKFSL